jgi:hypothetical protein
MSNGRWQYKVETVKISMWSSKPEKQDAQIQDRLTRLGLDGWELVTALPYGTSQRLYLKRGA